jgi:prepilin-type N-terminal cleavage/methylation domain-containing protein
MVGSRWAEIQPGFSHKAVTILFAVDGPFCVRARIPARFRHIGMRQLRSRGQSLVEILVVVGIIAILLSFLIPGALMLVKAVQHLKGQ